MFTCSHCDTQYPKWTGRCTECGKWGTIIDEDETASSAMTTAPTTTKKGQKKTKAAPVISLAHAQHLTAVREETGIVEFDRVLGGGLVAGSVTLLAGEPGIGKSTLVAQLAGALSTHKKTVYYASGEESEGQVQLRCKRLAIPTKQIVFSNTVDVASIIAAAQTQSLSLLIIDSIQTMYVEEVDAVPGSPNAVKAATAQLVGYAKAKNVPVLIIGQVTKEGSVAGPKTLEHLVDTVLTLEGDPDAPYRMLRVAKHRFGSTEEIGVFEMTEQGLATVENPSARFLAERVPGAGSVVCAIMDGNRPFLVEVQALVEKSFFANPVRRTSGYDNGRLQMLLAIINKRAGVRLYDQDVYVNIVGGVKVNENAADLAVAAAIISAAQNRTFAKETIFFGEVGLGGEIRTVPFHDRRAKEAERYGFTTIMSPKTMKQVKELV